MPDFSESDLKLAVSRLATCEMFPTAPDDRTAIAELLADLVIDDAAGLSWLTTKYRDDIGVWHGAASLRAMWEGRPKPVEPEHGCPYCRDHRGYEITYALRTQERRGTSLFTRWERLNEQQYREFSRAQLPANQAVYSGAKRCRCGIVPQQRAV